MKSESVFFLYLKRNRNKFVLLIITFLTGIALGILFVNKANSKQSEIIYEYIISIVNNIKNTDTIDKSLLLGQSLKNNMLFVFAIWIFGCSLLGNFLIYIAILYKGFSIGYTSAAIIASLGIKSRKHFCIFNISSTKYNFITNDFCFCNKRDDVI